MLVSVEAPNVDAAPASAATIRAASAARAIRVLLEDLIDRANLLCGDQWAPRPQRPPTTPAGADGNRARRFRQLLTIRRGSAGLNARAALRPAARARRQVQRSTTIRRLRARRGRGRATTGGRACTGSRRRPSARAAARAARLRARAAATGGATPA